MIVNPKLANAIAAGKATTIRFPARRGKAGAPYAPIPHKLRLAADYPIATSAGKAPIAHVRVVDIDREELRPTLIEARAAGYRTTSDHHQAWVREHDRAWLTRHGIDPDSDDTESILLARFKDRWLGTTVWVVRFHVVSDTLRYLAQPDPTRAQDDYTEVPGLAIDPLPCVDPVVQERYAKKAQEDRASFKRDLEKARQEQRNNRRDNLFRNAA